MGFEDMMVDNQAINYLTCITKKRDVLSVNWWYMNGIMLFGIIRKEQNTTWGGIWLRSEKYLHIIGKKSCAGHVKCILNETL